MQFLRRKALILLTYLFVGLIVLNVAFTIYHRSVTKQFLNSTASSIEAVIAPPGDDAAVQEVLTPEDNSKQQLNDSLLWTTVIEVVSALIGIPLLLLLAFNMARNNSKLLSLNREIEQSNRKYVFDSLEEADITNEEEVKARLLTNLKRAADFIKAVSNGNYAIQWEGLNDTNREANQDNIAGELIRMRDQMKNVKEQDEIRLWTTEGLSKFGEIIRNHQDNFDKLSESLISNVVKYVNAKMGGLFILDEDEVGEKSLQLRACYAYDRKKFITKKVEIGEGIIGQSYIDGQTVFLTDVPNEYVSITSGLGESNPKSLLVIPLKTNEKVEGVLELASLQKFKKHEIEFLEKLGELLASSIVTVRTSEKTTSLLQISQEQAEQMRAQEEEMRQNMEELEATQEQMNRSVAELAATKENLEKEKYLLDALMDNLPDAVYFKDERSKFIRVSKYLASHFNASVDELIGKSDFDFQDATRAKEAFDDERSIMITRKPKIDYIERELTEDGVEHWVSTTKMPLIDQQGVVVGTFGISRDVSKIKNLERDFLEKEKRIVREEAEYETKIADLEKTVKDKEDEIVRLREWKS